MPSSPNGHRAERECPCPSWAKPCIHFEGQVVYVVDKVLTGWYEVHGPTTILVESEDAEVRRHTGCIPLVTQSLPAAEAEFRKREAALLERVDA
jgi:hypothetical protein